MTRGGWLPWIWSALLHGVLFLGIFLTAQLSLRHPSPSALGPSVDAVAVDSQILKNLQMHRQAQADAARLKAEAEARARAEAEQRAKAEAQEKARAEAEAQAQAQAQAKAQAQIQAKAQAIAQAKAQAAAKSQATAKLQAAQAKASQLKAAQNAAKAQAQAAAQADVQAAHAQEQKLRAQREAELKRQLADEEKIAALQAGPLQKSYIASIQNRITRAWIKPASAHSGIVCSIEVTQVAGGEVTKVHVTNCNGDEAVRQSIENAVYRASPLPEPPDPALFQRNLTLIFKPNE